MGGEESLGDKSVSQVDGVSDMILAYWPCGGGGRIEKGHLP